VVGVITTLVERWVRQDAALVNARLSAIRLQNRRRELDAVRRFLAARESGQSQGATTQPP
jgi:hypothetical protein